MIYPKTTLYDRYGSIGGVVLIVLMFVSFCGLIFGIISMHGEVEKAKDAMAVELSEVMITADPENEKIIQSLKTSIQSAVTENSRLSSRINALTTQIDNLTKAVANKNNEIGFFSSERTRLESSINNREQGFHKELENLNFEKEKLIITLTQVKDVREKLQVLLNEQIDKLRQAEEEAGIAKRKFMETIEELRESKLVKETANMHYNLANHFMESKRYQQAVREYQRALALRPNDPSAHYNMAILCDIYTGDKVAAKRHYQRCLELDPKFPKRQMIEERITGLIMEHAAQITPTMAQVDNTNKYMMDNVQLHEN